MRTREKEENLDSDYFELKKLHDNRKFERDKQYKENSKRRLQKLLEKKFNTTIIGSLAAFEDSFGELWGHGKDTSELNENQKRWRRIWADARSRILDNGNSNSRAAQNEIAQYTVSWNRYVSEFPVKKEI